MDRKYIDINCDMGEGLGNEKDLLPFVSSCNIACGGHAGNDKTIREVALLAQRYGVKVGAHPSYPDRENFGRLRMDISSTDLLASLKSQVDTFASIVQEEHIEICHIKAHGSLYNDIAVDSELAKIFLKAIDAYKNKVYLYVPYNSIIESEAKAAGFKFKYEAFGDRNYTPQGRLVSRQEAHAMIQDPQAVVNHIVRMVQEREVQLPNGKRIPMLADTYCIHGDSSSALKILMYLSKHLAMFNLELKR